MIPTRRDRHARELAQFFALLSDATRLGILSALGKSPSNVNGLCRRLGLSQPTVSHHLAILRMGGLVHGQRRGKEIIYRPLKLPAPISRAVRKAIKGF